MRRLGLGVLALLFVCCSSPERRFDDVLGTLAECPRGDEAWREAIDLAAGEERLEELLALAGRLEQSHPDRWEPPWTAGQCLDRLGRPEPARASAERALALARHAADPAGIASSANDVGWLAYTAGDLAEADALYREALTAALSAERVDLQSFVRSNLAGLLIQTGDYAAARDHLAAAESGLVDLGRAEAARWTAYNRAIMAIQLGDGVGAEKILLRVYQEAQQAADPGALASSAIQLGRLHLALDELYEAKQWYGTVQAEDPQTSALASLGRGWVALREGDFAGATEILGRAADDVREHDRLLALTLEIFLAEAEMRAEHADRARARLERVIAEADGAGAEEHASYARQILGKVAIVEGQYAEAARHLERVIEAAEAQRAPLDPLDEGLRFLRERADAYADLAAAWTLDPARSDKAQRVFDLARRDRARGLGEPPPRLELASAASALEPGDLLLTYILGEDRGVVLALGPKAARAVPIAGRRELLGALRTFRTQLHEPPAEVEAASERLAGLELASALLAPVEDLLRDARRLWIVPDRELALIPFAALPRPGSSSDEPAYLGDELATAMLPLPAPPAAWSGGRAPVLLAGQPQLDPGAGLAQLPWAAMELSRAQEVWGSESTMLWGGALTLDALRHADLRRFRTIHFATHAIASTRDPRLCGVILGDGERLGIEQIVALELDRSLVVLSACDTAQGEIVPGEGIVGLGWAFLRAGAGGLVASLWPVDDAGSAKLMGLLHHGLREGLDPMQALAAAQRELRAAGADPSVWAPFVLIVRPAAATP
jgi:CHAT domain-containing protein